MTRRATPFVLADRVADTPSAESVDCHARIPNLPADPDGALDLIYSDYLAQMDAVQAQVRRRFYNQYPQFLHELERQFQLHDWLNETPPDLEHPLPPHREVDQWAGRLVGSYRVIEELGRGGLAIVYRAKCDRNGAVVALKVSRDRGLDRERRQRHLRSEGETLARLSHPSIIPMFEMGESQGEVFLALELLEGGTLSTRLVGQSLSAPAAALIRTLADAAQHMHDCGILHLDLNPRNVLMTADGRPKVADFGSARSWAVDTAQETVLETLGTPAYLAPELIDGDPTQLGPWTDVFGLGGILYQALTGRPPFLTDSLTETLQRVRGADPVSPRDLVPAVPLELARICLRCLAKEPADRYQTARGLFLALQPY